MATDTAPRGWTGPKASAFFAFAKGLAVMGNRDAGEHLDVFHSWWESYGAKDASRDAERWVCPTCKDPDCG